MRDRADSGFGKYSGLRQFWLAMIRFLHTRIRVQDLDSSVAFYEKLGFRVVGGHPAQNWLILQNETSTIGLFQGMFEKNMLTFTAGEAPAPKRKKKETVAA